MAQIFKYFLVCGRKGIEMKKLFGVANKVDGIYFVKR